MMKKMLKKMCYILLIVIGMLIALSFLSTIPSFTSIVDMVTNSVSYRTLGSGETISLWEKIGGTTEKEKLILGDSVADQLYVYRDNEEYCALTGNMAMSLVWQYIYASEFLERNPLATDIYLCLTPDIFDYSFETKLSYLYLVIPLAETDNMDKLEEEQRELLGNMFGSLFVKANVADYIGKSGFNKKIYLNTVDKFYETFPKRKEIVEKTSNPDSVLAETYIMKIYELCKEKNVTLHLIPNPKKDIPEYREYMKELEQRYKDSPLYEINPEYFNQIVYYPEECFKDELHFTDEFLEDGGKFDIIRDVQEATGALEGLLTED